VTEPRWREYESQIFELLRGKAVGHATIDADQKLPGRFSGIDRQIDIAVRGRFAGLPYGDEQLMIVDCKCFASNVDVKGVEAFAGMVDDVGAAIGLMSTNQGFSPAARARARGTRGLLVDVVEFGALDDWHPSAVLVYCERCGHHFPMPPYSVGTGGPGHCEACGTLMRMMDIDDPFREQRGSRAADRDRRR
jgi:hypothetical protein